MDLGNVLVAAARRSWVAGVAVLLGAVPPVAEAHADTHPPAPVAPAVVAAPSKAAGATVARVVAPSVAYGRLDRPRGAARRLATATAWSGQPQTLLVLDAATRDGVAWVKVLLPNRPNGSSGWVRRDRVVLATTPYWVEVRVRSRLLVVTRGGREVLRTRTVVGTPRTPTPLGLAAILERNRQPDAEAFLGPWALALTSSSEVLDSFGGGPGRIAVHGRGGASVLDPLGSARSHGCIRIGNRAVSWLATHLRAGTPVEVVAR